MKASQCQTRHVVQQGQEKEEEYVVPGETWIPPSALPKDHACTCATTPLWLGTTCPRRTTTSAHEPCWANLEQQDDDDKCPNDQEEAKTNMATHTPSMQCGCQRSGTLETTTTTTTSTSAVPTTTKWVTLQQQPPPHTTQPNDPPSEEDWTRYGTCQNTRNPHEYYCAIEPQACQYDFSADLDPTGSVAPHSWISPHDIHKNPNNDHSACTCHQVPLGACVVQSPDDDEVQFTCAVSADDCAASSAWHVYYPPIRFHLLQQVLHQQGRLAHVMQCRLCRGSEQQQQQERPTHVVLPTTTQEHSAASTTNASLCSSLLYPNTSSNTSDVMETTNDDDNNKNKVHWMVLLAVAPLLLLALAGRQLYLVATRVLIHPPSKADLPNPDPKNSHPATKHTSTGSPTNPPQHEEEEDDDELFRAATIAPTWKQQRQGQNGKSFQFQDDAEVYDAKTGTRRPRLARVFVQDKKDQKKDHETEGESMDEISVMIEGLFSE